VNLVEPADFAPALFVHMDGDNELKVSVPGKGDPGLHKASVFRFIHLHAQLLFGEELLDSLINLGFPSDNRQLLAGQLHQRLSVLLPMKFVHDQVRSLRLVDFEDYLPGKRAPVPAK